MALAKPNTVKTETAATEEVKAAAPAVEEQQAAPEAAAPEVEVEAEQTPEVAQPEVTATKPEPDQVKEEVQKAVQHDAASQPPVVRKPTAPAVSAGGSMEQDLADMGMEGLSIGGMSFDRIKLPNEGVFQFGPDEEELGKSFDAVIQNTRAIFIVRQSDEDDAPNYYSYQPDGAQDTNGVDKADTLAEWREDGYEHPSIKRYLEVMVQMHDVDENGNEGERHGLLAMAAIPPASIQRISGVILQMTKMRGLHPSQAVTTFQVGTKVKKGNNTFYPWTAKFKHAL